MNRESGTAYEYERFEERKRPKIKEVQKKAAKKRIGGVRAVCYMLILAAMLSTLVYTKMIQTELNDEYQDTLILINEQKSENARLQLKMEQSLSQENVEKIARSEYGMETPNPKQFEYVSFDTENKAEVVGQSSFWDNLFGWFQGLLG